LHFVDLLQKEINNNQIALGNQDFGGGVKYVHVASSKKFGHKNPQVAGVSFIWLPLATWITCKVSLIV